MSGAVAIGGTDFDGHHERPFSALTPEERLWWLDELIRLGSECRPFVRGGQGILRDVGAVLPPRLAGRTNRGAVATPGDEAAIDLAGLLLQIDDRQLVIEFASPRGAREGNRNEGRDTDAASMDERSGPPRLKARRCDEDDRPLARAGAANPDVTPTSIDRPPRPMEIPPLIRPFIGNFVVVRFENVARTRLVIDAGPDLPALVVAAVGAGNDPHLRLFQRRREQPVAKVL